MLFLLKIVGDQKPKRVTHKMVARSIRLNIFERIDM